MNFNYSITIDNLPSPTQDDCHVITSETGCFVRIDWYSNGVSDVLYGTNPGFPHDSVKVETERRVSVSSGLYMTHTYIAFICGSSNSTPCNTVENLKRSFISTTLPTANQIEEYDELIIPTKAFNSSLCFEFTNMTDFCPSTDLLDCQRCLTVVEYSQETVVCAACPSDEDIWNFFRIGGTFLVNNQTRLDLILVRCQNGDACNSMNNIEKIQRNLMAKFDFDKFFHSTTSTIKTSLVLLLISLYIGQFCSFKKNFFL
jgi:hypothetical protein